MLLEECYFQSFYYHLLAERRPERARPQTWRIYC
jgi:hypothetical protein